MKFLFLIMLTVLSGSVFASVETADVTMLPYKRVTFTTLSPIPFPKNADVDVWFQDGKVLSAQTVQLGRPACNMRRPSSLNGKVLRAGLRLPMPKSVNVRGPLIFRTIPVSSEFKLALDCSTSVERGWNGLPVLHSDIGNDYGKVTVNQLRMILKNVISITITPKN